jgi:hypothetical protein
MADQFGALPMTDLVAAPLLAACEAQMILAKTAADFIDKVGMNTDANGNKTARTVDFAMSRPVQQTDGTMKQELVNIQAPLLALVHVPALTIREVTIDFEMEVRSSSTEKSGLDTKAAMEASGTANWGFARASVKVQGSVSSHKESTRTSDTRAKYTVHVEARDDGPPEGLSRLLDIMAQAVTPKAEPAQAALPAPAPAATPVATATPVPATKPT